MQLTRPDTWLHLKMRTIDIESLSSVLTFLPRPGRGTGYCFRSISFFVSLFVSLSATLRENGWTDLHEIFGEGVE